ncbi:hypothetical protein [Marinobacter salicampi]|uniref:hypothetical protein n=1 Tax=Marinobacter salicampi TaxID=435907 RepID=UPI00140C0FFD|nr:hypothetical protein [Marinobacter salicampi]
MKIFEIALSAVLGATLGVALTYFVLDSRMSRMEERLAVVSPVASIDFLSIANNAPPEGLSDRVMKQKLDSLREKAESLSQQGFIVLRHEQLYSVPEGLVIRDTSGE